jgi:glycoprotein endo-alpha-1,2-mannosidase
MSHNPLKYYRVLLAGLMILALGCSPAPAPKASSKPSANAQYLIGAFYYLWYPGNWREGYINGFLQPPQPPALGQYDSSDPKTIAQHIAWSSQYGIHFWAISWWPGQPELDRILRDKVLKAPNIKDLRFCIFYETSGLGLAEDKITFTSDKTQKMISDFQYLAKTYFNHPSYLKIKGKPVVIIYLTRTFSGDYPEAISLLRAGLRKMGFDLYLIGDEIFWYVMRTAPLPPSPHPNLDRIKLFDAITAYNMYDWAKPKQMGYGGRSSFLQEVHDLYREYRSALGPEIPLIPAIIPGYNDRGVRLSEKHPAIPRRLDPGAAEGSFFAQALDRTILPFVDPELPMALITSFNEWNEGTQIEPTLSSGVTVKDRSSSGSDYTQGYPYEGYHKKYLTLLQDTFTAINGRVVDEKGDPLAQTAVQAFKAGHLAATALTDSQGFFNLSRFNLPPGLYTVRTEAPGYEESQAEVTVEEKKSVTLHLKRQIKKK